MVPQTIERVVDLTDPEANVILNMSVAEARRCVLAGSEAVATIEGSFALLARDGITVRMARSLDRPLRYFLAKRKAGPALFVADRIDTIYGALQAEGLADQFHPSYTRMVPAHHVVDVTLVGCPDPDPIYTRFFTPVRRSLPADLDVIGRHYIEALSRVTARWLSALDARAPHAPIGVCFSGGVDSGAVFLVMYQELLRLGMSPARLKAFVLNLGSGADGDQARQFLDRFGLSLFLEEISAPAHALDAERTMRVIEDYKPLDVECAAMGLQLCAGIRARYPEWRHLADGDGGDENLKDYPIEENPELTIRSVVDNLMLYHEGWGVGRIKHSLTYSGGLSRGYVRTYAPARHHGFVSFSPFTHPDVVSVAEGIPFDALTAYDVPALYALKGEVVQRGIRQVYGLEMPVFPKRRFQHGALPEGELRAHVTNDETTLRRQFHSFYA